MKLVVDNLCKSYSNSGEDNHVLENISFSVEEGEVVTLLGPSGCGKTTTLTIIAGFNDYDSGQVLLNGKLTDKPGPNKGFMFQNYALFPWMTVEENIRFPMKQLKYDKEKIDKRTKYLLDLARLTKYKDYFPHQISGGMKQRNSLVRALALEPEILLMDEPLGALDIEMRQSLQDQLLEIFDDLKLTVIIVTHDVEEAIYLSDRVILMSTNKGEIILNEKITMPHPRKRKDPQYQQYVDLLSEKFIEASKKGAQAQGSSEDE